MGFGGADAVKIREVWVPLGDKTDPMIWSRCDLAHIARLTFAVERPAKTLRGREASPRPRKR